MKEEQKAEFIRLDSLSEDAQAELKQARGRDFEKLINRIMDDEKLLLRESYHTDDNRSEQIDGAIQVGERIFLLEIKWVESNLAASELYAFIGKIENKLHGTLGIFISRATLSENFISALNKGRRQTVIVIHGEDIDLVFEKEFKFRGYIEHVVKVLSYDNIVHVPVRKFLELHEPVKEEQPATSTKAITFIQEKLFAPVTDKAQLSLDIDFGEREMLGVVYNYVLKNFYKAYAEAVKTFNYAKYRNYEAFLELYKPELELLKAEAVNYYTNLIRLDLRSYGWSLFTSAFSGQYHFLSASDKAGFEEFIVAKFAAVLGQYDDENAVTEIVVPIWEKLSKNTQRALSKLYLDIYITDRKDKFAQKAFANKLVNTQKIGAELIDEWLREKIKRAIASFSESTSEETIAFIARVYFPIAKVIGVETGEWLNYIRKRMPVKDK